MVMQGLTAILERMELYSIFINYADISFLINICRTPINRDLYAPHKLPFVSLCGEQSGEVFGSGW